MVVLAAAVALSGCTAIRKAAGVEKQTPDEFAVVTKAPLVIPPDYNLRPPKPGAVPTNQLSPTGSAEAALFSADDSDTSNAAPAPATGGTFSEAEKNLLAQADATNADHSIRQQIASDEKSMQGADESFTDRVLFGGTTDTSDKAVNADAASHANTPGGPGIAAAPADTASKPDDTANAPDGSATIKKDSDDNGGWLSWLGL
jgi:hypothetical protein